jgi:hypothetical protein
VGARWHGLANNGMTDEQRAALDPKSDEYRWRVNGSKTQLMGWASYSFLLWCLKAAMCTFYLRLTEGLKSYRTRIYFGFVLIVVTWITVISCVMFTCQPFHKNWQINPNPGSMLLICFSVNYYLADRTSSRCLSAGRGPNQPPPHGHIKCRNGHLFDVNPNANVLDGSYFYSQEIWSHVALFWRRLYHHGWCVTMRPDIDGKILPKPLPSLIPTSCAHQPMFRIRPKGRQNQANGHVENPSSPSSQPTSP